MVLVSCKTHPLFLPSLHVNMILLAAFKLPCALFKLSLTSSPFPSFLFPPLLPSLHSLGLRTFLPPPPSFFAGLLPPSPLCFSMMTLLSLR